MECEFPAGADKAGIFFEDAEPGAFQPGASHLAVGFIIIRTLSRIFKILNARNLPRASMDHPFFIMAGSHLPWPQPQPQAIGALTGGCILKNSA